MIWYLPRLSRTTWLLIPIPDGQSNSPREAPLDSPCVKVFVPVALTDELDVFLLAVV